MQDFRDLKVWEKSHKLTLDIYRFTKSFPSDEKFGLTRQLRNSAASVPTNIAEGCCRVSDKEFARFLEIAISSASETNYHLILAYDLNYIKREPHNGLSASVDEVMKMLSAFIKRLRFERER